MFKDNTYPFGTDQSALWAITYIGCNVAWYRNMPSLLRSSLSPTYVLHDCTCSLDDMVYTKLWIQSLFILIISPHLFFYNHVHYRCRQCKFHSHLRDVNPSSHTCCCIAVAAHCKTLKQAAAPEHFSMKKNICWISSLGISSDLTPSRWNIRHTPIYFVIMKTVCYGLILITNHA